MSGGASNSPKSSAVRQSAVMTDGLHHVYGDLWNDRLKAMIEPVTEERARHLYATGQLGVAAGEERLLADWDDADDLQGETSASWVIYSDRAAPGVEDAQSMVTVKFYDFWGTCEADYSFEEIDGRLFLYSIWLPEFPNTSEWHDEFAWTRLTEHVFRPDGTSFTDVTTLGVDNEQFVERTEYSGGDFTATHWEDWPEFGDWTSLTRRPRG